MGDSAPAIAACLGAIHRAVLAGDFPALPGLCATLEQGLGSGEIAASEGAARDLRRLAQENAVLLRAAQRGLRAAQRRVAEIRGVASGLTTYSATGLRQTSPLHSGSDHRA